MKYCKKCNRVFDDYANFCPDCGEMLEEPVKFDIFGEKIDNHGTKQETIIEDTINNNLISKTYEIFSYVSIGLMFLPIVGTVISLLSLYFNAIEFKKGNKQILTLIISCITFVVSIVWIIVVFKYNLIEKLFEVE